MTLSATQLLEADVLETSTIAVPEWARGGECEVTIRMMDGFSMSTFESRMDAAQRDVRADLGEDADDEEKAQARAESQHALRKRLMVEYCAACIVDPETGDLVYDTPAKIEVLARKRGTGLRKVFNVATALNADTAQAAEEFRKNLPPAPVSASGPSTPLKKDSDTPAGSSGS